MKHISGDSEPKVATIRSVSPHTFQGYPFQTLRVDGNYVATLSGDTTLNNIDKLAPVPGREDLG